VQERGTPPLSVVGVNVKALSSYMGQSTITMTLDRYGHLMLGNEDEAAMLAAYLERDARSGGRGSLAPARSAAAPRAK
jgi:hypothetical protein